MGTQTKLISDTSRPATWCNGASRVRAQLDWLPTTIREVSRTRSRVLTNPSPRQWIIGTAAANITTALISGFLVKRAFEAQSAGAGLSYGAGACAAIIVSAVLLGWATSVREAQFPDHPKVLLKMIRAISSAMSDENALPRASGTNTEAIQTRAIQSVKIFLRALEDVLSHSWSEERFGGTTELEAVIMNKAADGHVTVAAWAQKRPRSLDRRKTVPSFYDRTEAAKLYRKFDDEEVRAPIYIIPDISKSVDYDHFGRDPSHRTNSTALFPIYGRSSKLYGFVAVTARNRAGLFDDRDREFWNEVWSLWEPHLVRSITAFEATGAVFDEQLIVSKQ